MTLQDVKNTSQFVIGRENILLSNLWLVFFNLLHGILQFGTGASPL